MKIAVSVPLIEVEANPPEESLWVPSTPTIWHTYSSRRAPHFSRRNFRAATVNACRKAVYSWHLWIFVRVPWYRRVVCIFCSAPSALTRPSSSCISDGRGILAIAFAGGPRRLVLSRCAPVKEIVNQYSLWLQILLRVIYKIRPINLF